MTIQNEQIGGEQKIDLHTMPIEQIVQLYFHVKGIRSDLAKQDKELKEKQDKLEVALGDRCLEMGVDSFKAGGASITRSLSRRPAVADGQAFLKWATENDRMDLVQVKHYTDPIKEYLSKNNGELPDGMMFIENYSVSVRKSS
nr:MAG TPA_asm: hypothetical protein [Caudoviricetes sp.]